jgi:predicted MFS family arabinose efflux permease
VVVAIHGLLTVFFDLSFLSLLPGLVPHARLSEANAKLLGAQSAAGVAGPTLAGALVGFLGAAVAVLADAVSFAFSGALITSIRRREPKPKSTMTRTWDELVEGVRFVFAQPTLRTLTIWFSAWNLFSSGFFAILVVYYVRSLHLDAGTIGIVFAVSNVGIVIAAAVNERVVRRFGIGPVIAYFGPASDLCWIAFPLAPHAFPLPVLIGFGILGGMFGLLVNVNQLTLRQALTPPQLLGRMNSVVRLMYWGTIPIGATIGGVLAGPLGLRTTLVLTALLAVLAGLPITFSHIRRLSTIPETIATS